MTIHELRLRSNKFVHNLETHIATVVEHNRALITLNQQQFKLSTDRNDKPLVNSKTGSAYYSKSYARKKGYRKPDLHLTGTFYKEMDIEFQEPKGYAIGSYAEYTKNLVEMYDDIFGIGKKLQPKAKEITTKLLANLYNKNVLS